MAVRPPTRPAGQVSRAPRPSSGAPLPSVQALRDLLEPVVETAGAVVEDVEVSRVGRRVVVDVLVDGAEWRIDLDGVAAVSRAVSEALDAAPASLIPGAYTLEVGTPGVDRPLTLLRHWRRNVGRLVKVQRHGAPTLTGRVLEVGTDSVRLSVPGPKGRPGTESEVALGDVARAVVQVELSRPGPDDPPEDDLDDLTDLTDDDDDDEVIA